MKDYIVFIVIALSVLVYHTTQDFDVSGFETQYADFTKSTGLDTRHLHIKFGNVLEHSLDLDAIAVCSEVEPKTVVIDRTAWGRLDYGTKLSVIYHELGHCLLHRTHYTSKFTNGVPKSLMNSPAIDGVTFLSNKAYYIQELIGGNNENQGQY